MFKQRLWRKVIYEQHPYDLRWVCTEASLQSLEGEGLLWLIFHGGALAGPGAILSRRPPLHLCVATEMEWWTFNMATTIALVGLHYDYGSGVDKKKTERKKIYIFLNMWRYNILTITFEKSNKLFIFTTLQYQNMIYYCIKYIFNISYYKHSSNDRSWPIAAVGGMFVCLG